MNNFLNFGTFDKRIRESDFLAINHDKISKKQHAVLLGTIAADAHLQVNSEAATDIKLLEKVRLRLSHSVKQKHYIMEKHTILSSLVTGGQYVNGPKVSPSRPNTLLWYTLYEETLLPYYFLFYNQDRKKCLRPALLDLLTDPLSLAVLYLDDGTKRNYDACRLCASGLPKAQVELLQEIIKHNFGIIAGVEDFYPTAKVNLNKENRGYGLAFKSRDGSYKQFYDLIYEVVRQEMPSMLYKLE